MKVFVLLLSLAFASPVLATVTLQFSTTTSKLTNIQNAAGNATGGLRWGIVIDTAGNGFYNNGTNYGAIASFPSGGSGTFLTQNDNLTASDDYFFFGSTNNLTSASLTGTDSGTNAITTISSVPFGTNGISTGDRFGLIWFDSSTTNDGDKYGFLDVFALNSVLGAIPADSATIQFTSTNPNGTPFLGADPIRLAGNSFGAVPEPSRMMLLGFGLVGLFFRRRR